VEEEEDDDDDDVCSHQMSDASKIKYVCII